MDSKEFSQIRRLLKKTQGELAHLLCISTKAVQSFEQGWRNIPPSMERQLLFLLSRKRSLDENAIPCWQVLDCPVEWRKNCTAWELQVGNICWFINGTFRQGKGQETWQKKIQLCRQCKVFRPLLPIS